jgi:regulation of enolase protein 1 (concanavalin A-like superfamily)
VNVTLAGRSFESAGGAWRLSDPSTLIGTAGPRTDLFRDPQTGTATSNAPRLLSAAPAGDFQLSARVEVGFGSTYDAGVLLLWAGEDTWAKLCFELSPQGQPMIVSVVTIGRSDDANGFIVDGPTVWLRISGLRGAYAFHASTDGEWWHLIRHFTLSQAGARLDDDTVSAEVGFEVQSPLGEGCGATFTQIAYRAHSLNDLRDGR